MKVYIWMIVGALGLILPASCTKEQIVIEDRPLTLDKNSAESQKFLVERATDYMNSFRFTQAFEVIEQIADTAVKQEMLALYYTNRKKAEKEALMLVKDSDGDTVFFKIENASGERVNINFDDGIVPNEAGKLYGFKNFPNIKYLTMNHTRITGLMDLEYLTGLKEFSYLGMRPDRFALVHPGAPFTLPEIELDLSKNSALSSVAIHTADVSRLDPSMFPDNLFYSLGYMSFNASNDPGIFHGASLQIIYSTFDKPDFVFSDKHVSTLEIVDCNLETINTDEAGITALTVSKNSELRELTTGSRLNELILDNNPKLENISIPPTVTILHISNSIFPLADFNAAAYPLKILRLENVPQLQKVNVGEGLSWLRIAGNKNLAEITLPENLTKSQFTQLSLNIKRSCQVVNKPDWLDQYITYID